MDEEATMGTLETPTEKAERGAAELSLVLDGPVGMAECGCPNRVDGSPPALHMCRSCGFVGGYGSVHGECFGCKQAPWTN